MKPEFLKPDDRGVAKRGWYVVRPDGFVIDGPFETEAEAWAWIDSQKSEPETFEP